MARGEAPRLANPSPHRRHPPSDGSWTWRLNGDGGVLAGGTWDEWVSVECVCVCGREGGYMGAQVKGQCPLSA